MQEWKPIRVTIAMGIPEIDRFGLFVAYTQGDDWNGWSPPHFTESEVKRVVEWTRALSQHLPDAGVETVRWDESGITFIIENPEDPHDPDEPIPPEDIISGDWVEELGQRVFGIGAYRLTWELEE